MSTCIIKSKTFLYKEPPFRQLLASDLHDTHGRFTVCFLSGSSMNVDNPILLRKHFRESVTQLWHGVSFIYLFKKISVFIEKLIVMQKIFIKRPTFSEFYFSK